jgi:hypothetical protein
MELKRPKTPADALLLRVRSAGGGSGQFWIENDYMRLENHSREYASFSGYFGVHGPKMFAAAPEMAEVLKTLRDYISDVAHGPVTYSILPDGVAELAREDLARVDALLSRIEGDA